MQVAKATAVALRRNTVLRTTAGTNIEQSIVVAGGGVAAVAVKDGDFQSRSYPKGMEGNVNQGGYEFVNGLDLVGNAPKMGEEARELLRADTCPTGARRLILDLSDEGIERALKRATDGAKASGKGDFPGFDDGSSPLPELPRSYHPETAALAAGAKSGGLSPAFSRSKKHNLLMAGSYHTARKEFAIANSEGGKS